MLYPLSYQGPSFQDYNKNCKSTGKFCYTFENDGLFQYFAESGTFLKGYGVHRLLPAVMPDLQQINLSIFPECQLLLQQIISEKNYFKILVQTTKQLYVFNIIISDEFVNHVDPGWIANFSLCTF